MAMRSDTKRILTGMAASVVAVVLTLLCVRQCDDKNEARKELDEARTEAIKNANRANDNEIKLEEAIEDLRAAEGVADSLAIENRALTDSLGVVNQKLADCEKCKPCARRSSKTTRTARSSRAATTAATTTVATRSSGTSTTTSVAAQQTDDSATVTTSEKPAATAVTIGSGAHDNVVTVNNGTINNYYGTNDTAKAAQAAANRVVGECYTGRVVRCR